MSAGRRLRALIVEDEPVARRTLRGLLEQDDQVEVVGECAGRGAVAPILDTSPDLVFLDVQMPEMNGFEVVGECAGRGAVAPMRDTAPDLVFLDVQMPEMNGFEVLDAVGPEHVPLVIFVTAYDEFAVRAFELRALDYLLKPFSDDRFRAALEMAKGIVLRSEVDRARRRVTAFLATRASAHAADEIEAGAAGVDGYRERIAIKADGRITFVHVDDVDWLEATGSCVRVYTVGGPRVVRASLRELAEHLDPRRFFRIHRSAIINLDRIAELQHWSHGDYLVVLKDGTELRLTRSRRQALEAALGSPF